MQTSTKLVSLALALAVLSATLAAPNADAQGTPAAPPPKFTARELTAPPTDGWITNGGNLYNQRYSPLARINRDNVATLKPAWRTHLNGSGMDSKYSGQAQPIVYDGVIYIPTGANDVFALDADTGEILWTYEAHLDPNITVICCGWLSRGVALGDGKVFSGQLDGKLVALDHATGKVVWSIQAETNQDGFSITSAPLYYDGLVITGFAGGDRASRGRVKAYDARNGKLVWTFYTIPGPGEQGHDTWPSYNDTWKHGGAAVWQTPAVDPELGLVYFSTGNPGPDLNGSVRPGDNLFSVSMVAIEAKTGKYRWHFQQVHHDLWDYDSPNPVVLFDAVYDGKPRKGIVEIGKTGYVYILDRETGQPLVGIEERAGAAGAAPGDGRDAAVPARRRSHPARDRHRARGLQAHQQRPHLHAVLGRARGHEAARHGRSELAAELVRPRDESLLRLRRRRRRGVLDERGRRRVGDAAAGRPLLRRRVHALARAAARRLRGRRCQNQPAGVAAAVGRDVLLGHHRNRRRAHLRRPQRRPPHGARQSERRTTLGVRDGRRHPRGRQHV